MSEEVVHAYSATKYIWKPVLWSDSKWLSQYWNINLIEGNDVSVQPSLPVASSTVTVYDLSVATVK